MNSYRELRAWTIAHALAVEIHRAVDDFPPHERFELSSQLRRAALSVPTNLAEGQGRWGRREALRFARIAAGSVVEVDYLLCFAFERGYRLGEIHEARGEIEQALEYMVSSSACGKTPMPSFNRGSMK